MQIPGHTRDFRSAPAGVSAALLLLAAVAAGPWPTSGLFPGTQFVLCNVQGHHFQHVCKSPPLYQTCVIAVLWPHTGR
jgi:hypothetical protein